MKVFIFIPTLKAGGAERVVSILANNWSQDNVEVTILLLYDSELFYYVSPNVKIITLESQFKYHYKFLYFFQLRFVLKKIRPSVIQSFLTEYNILVLLSTIGLKIPVFVSDRANPLKHRGFFIESLRKVLYPISSGIISQTQLAKDILLSKFFHNSIKVIPNPLRLNYDCKMVRSKIILNVGRLIPEKNQLDLLTAFNKLKYYSDWKLVILGDGPMRAELETRICESNISNVELLGQVSNVEDFYRTSSIFAFTSDSEGYPNALAEAMSFNLPVVSYNCNAGPSDLIEHGISGFLVNVGDIEGISKYLEKLILDENLRISIGNEAKNKVNFNSEENVSKSWLNFITAKK